VAVAVAEPDVAVIVAVPFASAVTSPAAETVAIVVSDVAHVTVGLGITVPSVFLTVATSVAVSPIDVKLNALEDNSSVAAMPTTEIESSFVAVCPPPLVTCTVNVLVPVVVGVPEIVSAESVSPAGSVPAAIDQL
jgi:hypothetical protein